MRDSEVTGANWRAGPLPITQHYPAGRTEATSERVRRTLVARQQADVLYGVGSMGRTHLIVPGPAAAGLCVVALELLTGPLTEDGILAIHVVSRLHVQGPETALAGHLDALSESLAEWPTASELADQVGALLPDGLELDPTSRIRTVSFAIGNSGEGQISQRTQEWTYFLVTKSPSDRWSDMARRAHSHPLTIERQDWSALVLRDGAAFVTHQRSEEPFAKALRVYTHSVHLDAILLGILQRRLVDLSGERAVHASLEDPAELVALERSHFEFKRASWRTSLTLKRQAPRDDVLRAVQAELLTALDVAEVEDRVRDGARLARTLHGERQLAS